MASNLEFVEMEVKFLPDILSIYTYYVENTTVTFQITPNDLDEMKKIVIPSNPRFKSYAIFYDQYDQPEHHLQNGQMTLSQICGYVLLNPYRPREAFQDSAEVTIYLKQDVTGKGIGSAALQFIETIARQNHFHTLVSLICNENLQSIRLFKKHGYFECACIKECGKKFDRFLDLVIYQKLLNT